MPLPSDDKKFGKKGKGNTGHASKFKRKRSIEQEDRLAKKFGGFRIKGSGGGGRTSMHGDGRSKYDSSRRKGDVQTPDVKEFLGFKFEAKSTTKKSFSVSQRLIAKSYAEAQQDLKEFALAIEVLGIEDPNLPKRFVILEEDTLQQLMELAGIIGEDDKEV